MATSDHAPILNEARADHPLQRAANASVPALRPTAPDGTPKRRWWRWGTVGLVAVALALVLLSQVWMARPPIVVVELAAAAPVTRVLAVNGRIAAVTSVDIRAAATGRLVALPVAEGDGVALDQILAQVDAVAQNAAVRHAMAGLDAALVARQQAVDTHERDMALGANIPRAELETAARAVQTANQDVARMTAAFDQARAVLATYTVRAPIAGTVVTLEAEPGQLVGPSTALLTLADLRDLVVEADVDEGYAAQIAPDQPAVLQLAGETGTRDGHVRHVSARVDAATGGLAIKVAFDAAVSAPIGLTVATNIIVERRASALTVPRTALVTEDGATGVLVVADGVARHRGLTLVDWPAARLIVTDGLTEGEAVITDATGIADGQDVRVDSR